MNRKYVEESPRNLHKQRLIIEYGTASQERKLWVLGRNYANLRIKSKSEQFLKNCKKHKE